MGSLDFYVDFNIEMPNIGPEFTREAEQSLRKLASGHSDLVGASLSLEKIVATESSYLHQVRIVVYKRPEDIAVVEKDSDPMTALRNALNALEEKVRESREKLAQVDPHRMGDTQTVSNELSAEEVYATYAGDDKPEELIDKGRTKIASKLMVEDGLNQQAAYIAADQILRVAQEKSGK